jgi:hypothetical protein
VTFTEISKTTPLRAFDSEIAPGQVFQHSVDVNGDEWMQVTPQSQVGLSVPEGFLAQIDGGSTGQPAFALKWLDNSDTAAALKGERLVTSTDPATGGVVVTAAGPRRPPADAKTVKIISGEATIEARLDVNSGELFISADSLSRLGSDGAARWAGLFSRSDLVNLQALAVVNDEIYFRVPRRAFERVRGPGELTAKLKNEGGESLAQDLAADPAAFIVARREDLSESLLYTDILLAEGQYTMALDLLKDMERVHGPIPDITLRRSMVFLDAGDNAAAGAAFGGYREGRLLNPDDFYNEIRARLADPSLPRGSMKPGATLPSWQRRTTRQPAPVRRPCLTLSTMAGSGRPLIASTQV